MPALSAAAGEARHSRFESHSDSECEMANAVPLLLGGESDDEADHSVGMFSDTEDSHPGTSAAIA
eukprot:2377429-Karenia_brevis.AAC.1